MRWQFTSALVLLAAASLLSAQDDPFRRAPPEVEEALRSRVSEYYTLYQQGKFRQTEAFIAEEFRDAYYATSKNPIHSFEVNDINFAPDFQSAEVVVICATTVAIQTKGSRVSLPVHSRWKRVDGDWYALLGRSSDDTIETPFGKMKFGQKPDASGSGGAPVRPDPSALVKSLTTMYQLRGNQVLKFSSEAPSTQSITMSNTGPASLRLRTESGPVAGINVVAEPEEIENGETMELSFTYQPDVARLSGTREFRFTILPINQGFSIVLSFEEDGAVGSPAPASPGRVP